MEVTLMVTSGFSSLNAAAASSQYCLPSPVVELCHIVRVTSPFSPASSAPPEQAVRLSAIRAATAAADPRALRDFMPCSPLHRVTAPLCKRRGALADARKFNLL